MPSGPPASGAAARPAPGWSPGPPSSIPSWTAAWRPSRQAGLTLSSGYLANLGAVTALSGPGTLVISDQVNHASIVDACRLSRARVAGAPHRNVAAVAELLSARTEEHAIVVTDAVFSVDGDLAPLAELHRVVRAHGAFLIIDEAHAMGVVGDEGRGAAHQAGLAGEPDVVLTLTLSKSLAAQGGAVLGAPEVIETMIDTARAFIFDTGLNPSAAGAALAALDVIELSPELPARARANARLIVKTAEAYGLKSAGPPPPWSPSSSGTPQGPTSGRNLRGTRPPGWLLPATFGAPRTGLPQTDGAGRASPIPN